LGQRGPGTAGPEFLADGGKIQLRRDHRSDGKAANLKELADRCRAALRELDEALQQLRGGDGEEHAAPGVGHNQPPEPILSEDAQKQIRSEVHVGIAALDAPEPDPGILKRLWSVLGVVRAALARWTDAYISNTAKSAGIATGPALVVHFTGHIDKVQALIDQLIKALT
jgi:hypothetical protein